MATRNQLLTQKKNSDNARAAYQKSKKNILNYTNQIFYLNTDIIKYTKAIAEYEKTVSQRDTLYNAKETQYHATDGPILTNSHLNDLLTNTSYGKNGTQTFKTAIAKWKTRIEDDNQKIANFNKSIVEQQEILFKRKVVQPSKPSSNGSAPVVTSKGTDTFSKDWKYNAPMVKSAYFNSSQGLSKSLVGVTNDGNFVDAGKYNDALNAWKNTTGGRGTLQMDRKYVNTLSNSQSNSIALDPQMYGFKFLYNPKEVAMSWNQLMAMDPIYEASGQDAYTSVSAQLVASTVELTLLLNRIGDFAYINENGFNSGFGNDLDPTYAKFLQDDLKQNNKITNPYPHNVDVDDLKEIYKKGTMYDLEYLFKTINGPHATFISQLNGQTADRGWIRPTFVELHLGAGMRYRVRVIELSVTHSIFNSRMVPILSSVRLVLGRFNDGPQTYSDASASYNPLTGLSYNPNAQPGGTR